MPDNFAAKVYDHCQAIFDYSLSLEYLADAFATTGNKKMADKLQVIASGLQIEQSKLRKQYDAELSRQLDVVKEGAAETLRFALAYGAKEAERDGK